MRGLCKVNIDSESAKGLVGVVVVLTQCATFIRAIQPFLSVVYNTVFKVDQRKKMVEVRERYSSNYKLRTMVYSTVDGVIDIIQSQQGGYAFWRLLPVKGRGNKVAVRKKIANYLLSVFFNDVFLTMLLQAALTVEGKPVQHSQLYEWLLLYIYSGNVQELYSDWLKCSR